MGSSILRNIFLAGLLVLVVGCDPESLVREKVPTWLQDVLGAPPPTASGTAKGAKQAAAEVKLLSPKDGEVYPVDQPVQFRAEAKLEGGASARPNDLLWRVQGEKIGQGQRARKKLKAGKYNVEVTLNLPGKKTITQKASFLVAAMLTGRVVFNGKGLAGTHLVLESAEGVETIDKTVTKKDGSYALKLPDRDRLRLVPSKGGFSFDPPSVEVRHGTLSGPVNFTAAQGGISDIKLTKTEDSDEVVQSLCPNQKVYLKANISSQTPLARLQAVLVPTSPTQTTPVVLGEAINPMEIPNASDPKAPKAMQVRVPEYIREESIRYPFRLRITAFDQKGNSFSSIAKDSITIDMFVCYDRWVAQAASLQEKGDLEKAVDTYGKLDKYTRLVPDISKVSKQFAKASFNKGLAYAEMAVAEEKDSFKRIGNLGKAAHALERVREFEGVDPDTMLLLGWVNSLKGEYRLALEHLDEAIKLMPRSANAYRMRADTYVKTKQYKNLSKAVDDYTRALQTDPKSPDVRRSRREALRLEVKYDGAGDDEEVDVSAVPLATMEKLLKPKEYLKK